MPSSLCQAKPHQALSQSDMCIPVICVPPYTRGSGRELASPITPVVQATKAKEDVALMSIVMFSSSSFCERIHLKDSGERKQEV